MPESFLHYYLPHSRVNVGSILEALQTEGKLYAGIHPGETPLVSDAVRTAAAEEKIMLRYPNFTRHNRSLLGKTPHSSAAHLN